MEGKFYRYKTPNHPHTNMAKAALNMMTRTSAEVRESGGVVVLYAFVPARFALGVG
jgi:NAD(P)-dependent dehydrogenase (short-subunit alcohol dehydrogenase family)